MSTTGTAPIAPHAADDAAAEYLAGWLTRGVARATKTETRRHHGRPFDGECSELSAMSVSGMTMAPRWDQ